MSALQPPDGHFLPLPGLYTIQLPPPPPPLFMAGSGTAHTAHCAHCTLHTAHTTLQTHMLTYAHRESMHTHMQISRVKGELCNDDQSPMTSRNSQNQLLSKTSHSTLPLSEPTTREKLRTVLLRQPMFHHGNNARGYTPD